MFSFHSGCPCPTNPVQHNATAQAVKYRTDPPQRPFVLSRAFYAGSQRISAIWTGDNLGTWEHMAIGVPMVLSNGIAGMTFSGGVSGPDHDMSREGDLRRLSQLTLAVSLATLSRKCWYDGIKSERSPPSSVATHTLIRSAASHTCSRSPTRVSFAISSACDTVCCLYGTRLSALLV